MAQHQAAGDPNRLETKHNIAIERKVTTVYQFEQKVCNESTLKYNTPQRNEANTWAQELQKGVKYAMMV